MKLLSPDLVTMLTAITRQDAAGRAAFAAWRTRTPLDDIDAMAFKTMPMLAAAASGHDLPEADLARMKGVSRYIWVANTLHLRALFQVVDILDAANIAVMVIKGGALFARDPAIATQRMSSDYDILVEPGMRLAACEALEAAGYVPGEGFAWPEAKFGLPDRSGVPLRKGVAREDVDLHWRPLQDIRDPAFLDAFWDRGEQRMLNDRAVRVPSVSDHLFAALARPQPFDEPETFQRLLEGYFILREWPAEIDWDHVVSLAHRYGLALRTRRLLRLLAEVCGAAVPRRVFKALRSGRVTVIVEEQLRRRDPEHRAPLLQWFLNHQDRRYTRQPDDRDHLSFRHALQLQFGILSESELRRQWRQAVDHESRFPPSGLRFGQGFSAAEPTGRWTDGTVAVLRVPLRNGEPKTLSLPVLPYAEPRKSVKVRVYNGSGLSTQILKVGSSGTSPLTICAQPVAPLGGDGLLLFDLGFAHSPASIGASPDIRMLGLFFPATSTALIAA